MAKYRARLSKATKARIDKVVDIYTQDTVRAGGTEELHPEYGVSINDLLQMHADGYSYKGRLVPSRPVINEARMRFAMKWRKSYAMDIKRKQKRKKEGGLTERQIRNSEKRIGAEMVLDIQSLFGDATVLKSNAELTKAMKGGFDAPLQLTGDLMRGIDFEIT